jgi:hypothetical protein
VLGKQEKPRNIITGASLLIFCFFQPRALSAASVSNFFSRNKNFAGLLPIYDVIFGTFYMPPDKVPTGFGGRSDDVPENFGDSWSIRSGEAKCFEGR